MYGLYTMDNGHHRIVTPITPTTYLLKTVLITIQCVLQLEYCPKITIRDVLIHIYSILFVLLVYH